MGQQQTAGVGLCAPQAVGIIIGGYCRLVAVTDLGYVADMSVTLEMDEQTLNCLPVGPGERERLMQIELACRFCAKGWLTLGQGARMAGLDQYAFGVDLADRGIPRHYNHDDLDADIQYAGSQ